jgi:hypothetical protein
MDFVIVRLVAISIYFLQSNKLTRTEYSQTYPYTGQITATKEYIETNDTRQLLNEQINTYRDKSHYSDLTSVLDGNVWVISLPRTFVINR